MKSLLIFSLASMSILASCGKSSGDSLPGQSNYSSKTSSNDKPAVITAIEEAVVVVNPTYKAEELKEFPKLIDLKEMMTSVKNQESRDTSTYFALIASIEAGIKKDLGYEINLSEEYLINATKPVAAQVDSEASTIDENMKSVTMKGLLVEKDSVYQPSASLVKVDSKAMKRTIPAESIMLNAFDKNINEMIRVLSVEKRPLILSINMNLSGWNKKSGEVKTDDKTEENCKLTTAEKSVDCRNHSVVITGYDLNKKVFMFKNSWGESWGQKGYGTIPFNVVDKFADTSVSFVGVVSNLVVLKDFNKKPLDIEVTSFESEVSEYKGTLEVDVNSALKNLSGRSIKVQSCLYGKDEEEIKCVSKFLGHDGKDTLKIKAGFFRKPTLIFSAKDLETITPAELKDSKNNGLHTVTGVYYVDDTGTHLLKELATEIE